MRIENRDQWSNIFNRITIRGDQTDVRYADYPFSEILFHHRIAHAGIISTLHPYELTRVHQNGSCMVSTLEGEGKVLIDGEWVIIPVGYACLLPPFAFNSIQSIEGKSWTFVWVKYLEDEGTKPIVTAFSPSYGLYDAKALEHAILGLHHHLNSHKNKVIENLWVELIHKQFLLFSKSKIDDERLWTLWTEVQQNLSYPWTMEELAEKIMVSTEHLRRLCQKQFGRSPKQHLEHLRMRKARILLGNGNLKIEMIAHQLGYSDAASFSNAFKKMMGFRPSKMR